MQFFPGIFYPYKWNVEVYLEPGEAVALNAGYLACRVLDIVRNGRYRIAILNASAACHMPDVIEMPYMPPLYGATEAEKRQRQKRKQREKQRQKQKRKQSQMQKARIGNIASFWPVPPVWPVMSLDPIVLHRICRSETSFCSETWPFTPPVKITPSTECPFRTSGEKICRENWKNWPLSAIPIFLCGWGNSNILLCR